MFRVSVQKSAEEHCGDSRTRSERDEHAEAGVLPREARYRTLDAYSCSPLRGTFGKPSGSLHQKTCWQTAAGLTQNWSIRGPVGTRTGRLTNGAGPNSSSGKAGGRPLKHSDTFVFTFRIFTMSNGSILGFSGKGSEVAGASLSCTCCGCEKPCRCGSSNQPKQFLDLLFSCTSRKFPHSFFMTVGASKNVKSSLWFPKIVGGATFPEMVLEWFPSYKRLNIYVDGREWKLNLLGILKTPSHGSSAASLNHFGFKNEFQSSA